MVANRLKRGRVPRQLGLRWSPTMSERKCPKCGAEMEAGYVPDYSYGPLISPSWFPGVPEISRWYGLKTKGKPSYPISTYCCVSCGFLESYAYSDASPVS